MQLLLQRQTEFQHGELLNALVTWQKYIERHPEDKIQKDELSKAKCIIYTQEGKEEAMQYCVERLSDNTKDVTALRCRAQLLLANGEYTRARHDVDLLITLEPHDPIPYQQIAYIEQVEGNLINASQYVEKAVELHIRNKSPVDKLNKAKEQLASIQTNITGRTISNLSQCLGSVLQAFSDYFTTPLPSIEKPFMAKPSLPQFVRFSLLGVHEENPSMINTENLVETVRYNSVEQTILTAIGESSESAVLASDEPTLLYVGESQFIPNDSIEMNEMNTVDPGEAQLYQEDISIREPVQHDADKKIMMALSIFVKNQQFWLKPNQQTKPVINLHGIVVGNERTIVPLTRVL